MVLDLLGKPCPLPVIEAKKAIRSAKEGEIVEVLVDNDIARQNLEKMATGLNCGFAYTQREDGNLLVAITVKADAPKEKQAGFVVAIGSSTMGKGNAELGGMLMKSFIFSLTELDTPPEKILFYNGGVHLVVEGAATLEDLKTLEEKGTQLYSCGACLNYYAICEKLKVGTVTNMYEIASAMSGAAKLVNL